MRFLALLLGVFLVVQSAFAATFVVDDTGDGGDSNIGNGVCRAAGNVCTLRAAIQEANATGLADTIEFNIAPAGPKTIVLTAALPIIQTPMTIDGTTQPGFVAAPPFAPVIELNAALGGAAALDLRPGSSGSTIRGLIVNRCPFVAIRILGSSNNVIAGNFIGTNPAGTAPGPGNQVGVFIGTSAIATDNNLVGGTAAADRNLISGNTTDGIQINAGTGGAATNVVQGNYIGVDVTGTLDLGNASQGVALFTSTGANTNNTIGGLAAGAGNVISGNGNDGILIANAGTTGTLVQGNHIGTNAAGTAPIPNLRGIEIGSSCTGNTIGGTAAGSRNVISGNSNVGILVFGSSNQVLGNYVGTDAAGTAAVANGGDGIFVQNSTGNTIGGTTAAARNVLSGNTDDGIEVDGATATGNVIQGNYVGLDATGTAPLGNGNDGIVMWLARNNTIGGTAAGAGNVVSGNQAGLYFGDVTATGNAVQGNYIGTNAAGTGPVGNITGVFLDAAGTTVGGLVAGARNVISGNTFAGLWIRGANGTVIQGNYFGTRPDGVTPLPNASGVYLEAGANNNTIGGIAAGASNRIAYNANDGVVLISTAGNGNQISTNEIHTNGGLGIDLLNNGVTPNDLGDPDAGPNDLQNFPVLSAAMTVGGNVNIAGSLDGAPSTTYRVEFFATTAAAGSDEGERFLGFADITTDAGGNAVFGRTFAAAVFLSENVTATATDPGLNTSEFSPAVKVVGELVVTTTADTVDGTTTSVANLVASPGADGRISLREAILATNATAGANTIRFGIPLADAGHFYYQNDSTPSSLTTVAVTPRADADTSDFDPDYPAGMTRSWYRIRPTAVLPDVTDTVVLDAQTQPGYLVGAPVVELDGSLAGAVTGLSLMIGPSTVRGLVINRWGNDGLALRGAVSGYSVTGNYIGTDASGTLAAGNTDSGVFIGEIGGAASTIGGSTPAERNIISGNGTRGLYLWAWGAPGISSQIRIQGNYIGTDVTGAVGLGVQVRGMTLEFTGGHVIGGAGPGEGNLISGNAGFGIELNGDTSGSGTGADNNLIEANRVGTNAAGIAAVPNSSEGIILFGTIAGSSASNNTIRGNVIAASGGTGHGILAVGNADNNLYEGNFIGTDSGGAIDLGNAGNGILIQTSGGFLPTGNTVRGNTVRFNDLDGVRIVGTGSSVTLSQNQISSNDGLGIDLSGDGITANDLLDGDSGPNNLLNFPFATAAIESGGVLTAYYKLDVPAGSYRVEFFKNPSGADPSGNGEGETFASAVNVNHPGGGSQNFNTTFAGAVGDVITATATFCTDGAACTTFGSSSEFSGSVTAVTTAVELVSFDALPRDGAVELSWRTGSELDNLGFHLYRSLSSAGPYDRITDAVIPGLGSSPSGASYGFTDSGLTNGVEYFYKLEDIETTGRTELHGPISAVPESGDESAERTTYGDPADLSFRILERSPRGVLVELVTGGFYGSPEPDGSVRLEVPGFEELGSSGSPAIPVKRAWLEVVAGRRVSIANVRASEETSLNGLRPANAPTPEVVASPEGTVRAGSRRGQRALETTGIVPASPARLVETGFQGDVKKALLELAPLRWDGSSGQLLWAKRLQVRLSFRGVEASERASGGSRGRRHREEKSHGSRKVLARLATSKSGLYRARLADVLGSRRGAKDSLRLSHRGEAVPFHVESSALYFLGEGDSVYELESSAGGKVMPVLDASPTGTPVSSYVRRLEREENHYYQAGLLDAPSLWLWDVLVSPGSKIFPFTLSETLPEEAKLEVYLQGASDFEAAPDHHVRVSMNGVFVGEVLWDGKSAKTLEAPLAPGVLREGANELSIESTGASGVPYSMVFLDRFAVTYRGHTVAEGGSLEGGFDESGTVSVEGLSRGSLVVQTSPETAWLRGVEGTSFRVEGGRSYLATSPGSVLEARVRRAAPSALRSTRNQADYLLIGPREFLPAAEPLLRERLDQGLVARAVAIEEVYDEFGFGEARPEALKEFLEFAYHHWAGPSPRYVVLFGDATYDTKNYLQTGVRDKVPALISRTSYLWTASDPLYAAVNGEDRLPDLALGRLPAATLDEARVLVEKVLEYEESGQSLSGRAVVVADDPDAAGDFEADSDGIAAGLAGREVQKIYLRELGAAETRRAIVESFDRGASLLSYAGHGGIALWASENIFESADVEGLSAQPSQPIVMTMNCLNGYYHFPYFDSLAEALVKARQRGAIAAFSPSGLSLDSPAHFYQQALLAEIASGRHARLGDAVLAAQTAYAESGLFPELLAIYHLFGDPALRLR